MSGTAKRTAPAAWLPSVRAPLLVTLYRRVSLSGLTMRAVVCSSRRPVTNRSRIRLENAFRDSDPETLKVSGV
jgi:hypothetical protein